jgi:hypothetical protein
VKPTEAYPLTWPAGWRRTPAHERVRARFNIKVRKYGESGGSWLSKSEVSIAQGTERVLDSLNRMGFNRSVVISSNLSLRNDGLPRSNQRGPDDPGVAVYTGPS